MAYLERRRRRWLALHDIPADVQALLGKRRFVKSLETEDKGVAKRRAAVLEASWLSQIDHARERSNPESDAAFYRRALREAPTEAERQRILASVENKSESLIFDAYSKAGKLLEWPGEPETSSEPEIKTAVRFRDLATGKLVPFTEHLGEYLAGLRIEDKDKDMRRAIIARFAETFPYIADVQRKAVQKWINQQAAGGKAAGTIRRALSALRGYWRYLGSKEEVSDDNEPFDRLMIAQNSKEAMQARRQHFEPADVLKLLGEARKGGDAALADLIEIAAYTGARVEEITSLKVAKVKAGYIEIGEAKTAAGWRQVPIHSKLAPTIKRLATASTDGFMISGLGRDKYGDRRGAISKRFSRLKTALGFGPDLVFHSIRKTVATMLENAGVAENVAADILGHEKPRITYGLYSGGASLAQKLEAIEKLNYSS
ncbi:MAG: tyrosine-type recombinase/integrase [Alphaproteobacteria bacterium]